VALRIYARCSVKIMGCTSPGTLTMMCSPNDTLLNASHRELVGDFLRHTEPNAVTERRHRRFKRKRFICAGVNEIWTQDQHDKWKRFGLWLHNSIDPFIGYNLWMKIWWTNRNPKLITSYYIEAVRKLGGRWPQDRTEYC
jgi:hypothetical protein